MAELLTKNRSFAQRSLLGSRLFAAPAFARCVWQQAAIKAWNHGFKVAPGLLTLAAVFGAALGAGLFPLLRDFGILGAGLVWIPNWINFEIAPLIAALWYGLFSGPRHLLTAISLRNGDGAVLTASGVHPHYFLDIPGFWGAFISIFTQTILIWLSVFTGALVFWSVRTQISVTPLLEGWSSSLNVDLLLGLPIKIAALAYILTQIPLKLGQRFSSMDELTRAAEMRRQLAFVAGSTAEKKKTTVETTKASRIK